METWTKVEKHSKITWNLHAALSWDLSYYLSLKWAAELFQGQFDKHYSAYKWRHGGHIGVPKQRNGSHVGVRN